MKCYVFYSMPEAASVHIYVVNEGTTTCHPYASNCYFLVWCMAIYVLYVCVCSTFLYIVLSGSSLHSQHTVVAAAGMSYIRVIQLVELTQLTFISRKIQTIAVFPL